MTGRSSRSSWSRSRVRSGTCSGMGRTRVARTPSTSRIAAESATCTCAHERTGGRGQGRPRPGSGSFGATMATGMVRPVLSVPGERRRPVLLDEATAGSALASPDDGQSTARARLEVRRPEPRAMREISRQSGSGANFVTEHRKLDLNHLEGREYRDSRIGFSYSRLGAFRSRGGWVVPWTKPGVKRSRHDSVSCGRHQSIASTALCRR
jgi:hypothetical protein